MIELRWKIDFRHNEHFHPVALGILGPEGSIEIPDTGHDFAGDTAYRFTLLAIDSAGLSGSTSVEILPDKTHLILETVPSGLPITNLNHPPFIRLENHSLTPLGHRDAKYKVPAKCIKTPGRYRLSIRMRSRAEPIYFMRFCKATPEMERRMNERMLDFHQHAYEFVVK